MHHRSGPPELHTYAQLCAAARRVRRLWRGTRRQPSTMLISYPDPRTAPPEVADANILHFVLTASMAAPAAMVVDRYARHVDDADESVRAIIAERLSALQAQGVLTVFTDHSIPGMKTPLLSRPRAEDSQPAVRASIAGDVMSDVAPVRLVLCACSVIQLLGEEVQTAAAARVLLLAWRVYEPDDLQRRRALGAVRAARRVLGEVPRRGCYVCGMSTRVTLPGWSTAWYACVVCGDEGASGRPMGMRAAQRSAEAWRVRFASRGASHAFLDGATRPPHADELPPGTLDVSGPGETPLPACRVCNERYRGARLGTPVPACDCWLGRALLGRRCGEQPAVGDRLWALAQRLQGGIGALDDGYGLCLSEFDDLEEVARQVWPGGTRDGVDLRALASFGHVPALDADVAWRLRGRWVLPGAQWVFQDILCPEGESAIEAAAEVVASLTARMDQLHAEAGARA